MNSMNICAQDLPHLATVGGLFDLILILMGSGRLQSTACTSRHLANFRPASAAAETETEELKTPGTTVYYDMYLSDYDKIMVHILRCSDPVCYLDESDVSKICVYLWINKQKYMEHFKELKDALTYIKVRVQLFQNNF